MRKNRVKVYFSDFLLKRTDNIILYGLSFLGLCILAWAIQWVLCRFLGYRAEKILKPCLALFVGAMILCYGYMSLNLDRMGLVLGIDSRNRLYWLPPRKQILRDPKYAEEPDIQKMLDVDRMLPDLPDGAKEIQATVKIREKDGYYHLQCLVRPREREPLEKMKFAVSPHFFKDFDEVLEAFRVRQ